MDAERAWKWAERAGPVVIAPLCSVAALYFAAATYYGWDKLVPSPAPVIRDTPWWSPMTQTPWLGFALLCVAIASVLTSWGMILIRRRAENRKLASQEFVPKGNLVSLNEIEFNPGRLSQAAPWLELYLTFSNATGYEARPLNVTGRVTISGQEFHGRIELVDTLKSHGSEPFFRFGLKIPVSASEAQYCLDCIQRHVLSLDFSEAIITFGITIYGTQGTRPELNVFLPKKINFNVDSLRTDPYLPWKSTLR